MKSFVIFLNFIYQILIVLGAAIATPAIIIPLFSLLFNAQLNLGLEFVIAYNLLLPISITFFLVAGVLFFIKRAVNNGVGHSKGVGFSEKISQKLLTVYILTYIVVVYWLIDLLNLF